jgi:nitrogen fixation/metabolism regulation signal transduction histidine kinase
VSTIVTGLVLDGFCAALAMILGAWIVGRPMGAPAAKARRVGQGDFGGPLAFRQHDEIATLATEMNAMCERLAGANERVAKESSARIEQRALVDVGRRRAESLRRENGVPEGHAPVS